MTERPTHEIVWLNIARRLAPRNNEGVIFETRFQAALEELEKEGKISGWTHIPKDSEEDRCGRDFVINYQGIEIPWQVTSTSQNRRRHIRARQEKSGEDIPTTSILESKRLKTVEDLKIEILREAEYFLELDI